MYGRVCDMAIVGGGLSGALIALALAQRRPDLTLCLIEAGPVIGGNHRWSWFATDLPDQGEALLAPLRKTSWDDGYEVRFPAYARRLGAGYRSLASADLAAGLARELPRATIRTNSPARSLDEGGVTLADGTRIGAGRVIDCRGLAGTAGMEGMSGGWQVFMGRHIRTHAPHAIARPVIMDATIEQSAPAGNGAAYRFVYVLPLASNELFIEDTYYADSPALDPSLLAGRIDQYCHMLGIEGEQIGLETGILPVISAGDFAAFQRAQAIPGVAVAGARGGFFHPLTSYTLPFAVEVALAVSEMADLPGGELAARLEILARGHWRRMGFYRMLARLLFGAAEPQERYRVFERFYRLGEPLVERFYAGRSSVLQMARVLVGRPPVPIFRALAALARRPGPIEIPARTPDRKDCR